MKLVIIQYFQVRCVSFSSGANVLPPQHPLPENPPIPHFTLKVRHHH